MLAPKKAPSLLAGFCWQSSAHMPIAAPWLMPPSTSFSVFPSRRPISSSTMLRMYLTDSLMPSTCNSCRAVMSVKECASNHAGMGSDAVLQSSRDEGKTQRHPGSLSCSVRWSGSVDAKSSSANSSQVLPRP